MPTTINPSGQTITQYNIQTGGASNLLNNVAPSSTSGVPVISQGASAQPIFGTAVVAGGGTGQTTLTNHGVLVGAATAAITQLAAGSAGQVLQSGGASADPAYSTATFPTTATGTGTLLRADGTNWVATTSTYPNTNAVSTLLYASSANVMAALATANNGVLITSNAGVPSILAETATAGIPLVSGGTGVPPAFTTAVVAGGGTGATTLTGVLTGNGTSAFTASTVTQHGVVVAGASNALSTVAPGSSGNVLTSNGTDWASTASTASGSMVLLTTLTASNSASVAFTSTYLTSTYLTYVIIAQNISPVSNAVQLQMTISDDNGSTYKSANYQGGVQAFDYNSATPANTNSTSLIPLVLSVNNGAGAGWNGNMTIYNVGQTGRFSMAGLSSNSGGYQCGIIMGMNTGQIVVNNIRFKFGTGNISSGTFSLYGIAS